MKKEVKTIERTVTEERVTYVAADGTEFKDETECNKYEESALCAIKLRLPTVLQRIKNFPKASGWFEDIFGDSCQQLNTSDSHPRQKMTSRTSFSIRNF